MLRPIAGFLVLFALSGAAAADEWLPTLSAGQKAAAQSGRSILYVTSWKPGT